MHNSDGACVGIDAAVRYFVLMKRVKNSYRFMLAPLVAPLDYEIDRTESLTEAVVRALSAVNGCPPETLPPLAEVLDPDALDMIFDKGRNGNPRPGGRISFIYNGCRITIDNGEYLTIHPITDVFRSSGPNEPRLDGDA